MGKERNYSDKYKIGLIVNPISGLGGPAGFKGTDEYWIVKKSLEMGYKPISPAKTVKALNSLKMRCDVSIITCPGEMGEIECKKADVKYEVIDVKISNPTTRNDTIICAREIMLKRPRLIVFSGGDGTAADILNSIDQKIPVIGIPSGVKIFSSCFAISPEATAEIICKYLESDLPTRYAEVLDIDEKEYRLGRLNIKLKGYLITPYDLELVQGSKKPTHIDEREEIKSIAKELKERLESGIYYVMGPGSTVKEALKELNLEGSLLGFDIIFNGKILKRDVNEKDILNLLSKEAKVKVIITPIGGSGFLIGRGNQQLSSKILSKIDKKDIIVVATKTKLYNLRKLLVDTGDPNLDMKFKGYIRVITGYREEKVMPVECYKSLTDKSNR